LIAVDGALHPLELTWAVHYPGAQISVDVATCNLLRRVSSPIGRFLVTPDARYWLVTNKQKRLLTGKVQYRTLRGNGPAAIKASASFADLLSTGKPVKKTEKAQVNLPNTEGSAGNPSTNPSASPVPSATPSPTPSPTVTPSPAVTPSPTAKPSPTPTPSSSPRAKTYKVVAGDTLNGIAAKLLPANSTRTAVLAKATAIAKANKIANPNGIQVGQVLVIP